MFKLILMLLFPTTRVTIDTNYCELDRDGLTLDQHLEMSMGCSTVRGRYVYRQEKIKRIYEEK